MPTCCLLLSTLIIYLLFILFCTPRISYIKEVLSLLLLHNLPTKNKSTNRRKLYRKEKIHGHIKKKDLVLVQTFLKI